MAKKEIKNENLVKLDEETWVWAHGYKATDSNMCCQAYQYELGKQHDMPEDAKIKECECGFHLCLKLEDVFRYYGVGKGNRYFKVKALVRVNDLAKYGNTYGGLLAGSRDKLVAKSIIFERELTPDEILTDKKYSDYTEEEKLAVLEHGARYVEGERKITKLMEVGYTRELSDYIVNALHKDHLAYALGTQPEINMNVKICLIFDTADRIMIDTGIGNVALRRGSR